MPTRRRSRWLLLSVPLLVVAMLPALRAAGDPQIVAAARENDMAAVTALLARRADVNAAGADGSTALLWAAYHTNLAMTRALLAARATADTPNRYGVTPLLQASRAGATPIMQALLRAGARFAPASGTDTETPLMAAAHVGNLDGVRLLLEAGADVNASDAYQKQTALMWAAAEGHTGVVTALLAAGADANRQAHVTTLTERKHGDHPSGGFTALMFAAREGHEDTVRALVTGGADPKRTNGDGVTATIVAIVNDRLDLAATLLGLGADPNDGSLYFAVDMHDATTDMRAKDGSRLRADHPNRLSALALVKLLLERGADPNKPFVGQTHSFTLCCSEDINSSPFYRAAVAADVEALKLLLAHGGRVEWSPAEIKKKGAEAGRGVNANVGKTPLMVTLAGGRGAPFNAGPGFDRLGPPPFREPSNREPIDAVTVLLAAGADPNATAPDGSTLLHQAVTARQVPIIRALVTAGARLDATNKDNLTPLLLAEKPPPPPPPGNNTDPNIFRRRQDSREDVIAALRELMHLGPNDPAPVPPPKPAAEAKSADAGAAAGPAAASPAAVNP